MPRTRFAEDELLALDPDRLFPEGEKSLQIARELYSEIADAPIISPHGHVDPYLLFYDDPFPDPVELLIKRDHYITRLLHASGITHESIHNNADSRSIWRTFCSHWDEFQGTASA